MPLFLWEEKYTVNVVELDEQHKKLISLINRLFDSMKEGHGKDVLSSIVSDLFEYTIYHFDTEENYFHQYKYVNTDAHIKEHTELRAKVVDIKNKLDTGKMILSSEIMTFLKQWLINHIMTSDKEYSTFFNHKGLY